jgi:hypothetical protein
MKTLRFISGVLVLVAVLGFTKLARATNSPDGGSITPAGGGSLITSAGTWTFSTTTGSGGNNILLNGTWVNARGIELIVGNGGQMYNFSSSSHWYVWSRLLRRNQPEDRPARFVSVYGASLEWL